MKIIPIPLSFGVSESIYETNMGFKTADVNSAVLQFTGDIDPVGCVATLTMNNETNNANRVSTVLEQFDVEKNPFDYLLQEEIQSDGVWLGEITLKRNLITVCSQKFRFAIGSSLQQGVIGQLVKSKSLDELVMVIREDVMEHLGKNDLSVKGIEKYVNEVVAKLLLGETNRNLNEEERKLNEITRKTAFEVWSQAVSDLIDQGVIDQRVQAIIEEFQSTYSTSLFSLSQQLEQAQADLQAGMGALTADSEVVTARISGVTGKTHTVIDNRFEDLESDSFIGIKNFITNGDFSNGSTGWTANKGILTVADNIATVTGNGSLDYVYLRQQTILPVAIGSKVYIKAKIKVTNAECTRINVQLNGTTSGSIAIGVINNPVIDTWYEISGVVTITGLVGDYYPMIYQQYVDAATANGKVMQTQYVVGIDETLTMGTGNEPEKREMDLLLSEYTNKFFSGTVNLANNKKLIPYLFEQVRDNYKAINGVDTYTTVPTFDGNGVLTQAEDRDGVVVKKRSTLAYNGDGTLKTVTEKIEGKTIITTINYVGGVFSTTTKTVTDGGL